MRNTGERPPAGAPRRVLVLGSAGQLGSDLVRTNPGQVVLPHTRGDADFSDVAALRRFVEASAPTHVLNTVAFNQTERCEEDPAASLAVNTLAPRALADLCAERGIRLVHFSTDFVFDGTKGAPYVESDAPAPINMYGLSKYGGERFVLAASPGNLVVRTASLYGAAGSRAKGGNFVYAILRRAQKDEPLRVVSDISVSPTYTLDLARKVWELLDRSVPGGVYHLTNSGGCTWYEFAQAILHLANLRAEISPIPARTWPGKMKRSPDTRLSSERLAPLGLSPLRPWRDALASFLKDSPLQIT